MPISPIEAVRALYRALEAGAHGPELERLFTEDCVTVTHPNLVRPRGGRAELPEMLAAAQAGAGLLARQAYEVRSMIEVDNLVIARATWTGEIGRPAGSFRAGQVTKGTPFRPDITFHAGLTSPR